MQEKNGKEILVIGHCLANVYSRLKGIKAPPKMEICSRNVIQLPCPEMIYLGSARREITKDQLETPNYRRFCRSLFEPFADMLEQFYQEGYSIKILGVPKSPSCGAQTTTIGGPAGRADEFAHEAVEGLGVFYEEIVQELEERGVFFEMCDA
ncbi:hypothetical protein LI82_08475 [Methanococcoides methylutens]|uniref:DUF523 domain-containing protein n=1 Tax=Methanococcoides methylutens TaxID=2226 RepID=A0A099T108_METMT|nr:DUF523 domain-containing protein [Methanococcoides methylutens]KGK97798.1 hypothetical protein LI82_08475 [Methanococcoides methylutens]